MYEKILSMSFEEALSYYRGIESADRARKIITIKDCDTEDTFPKASDIILYYDIVEDSTPLLLVERLNKSLSTLKLVKSALKVYSKNNTGYFISYDVTKDGRYIDITVLKRNIYDQLTKA